MQQEKEKHDGVSSQSIAISAKQLSRLLGVSLRQVWRLNATGKLPRPIRIGGSVRWNRAEVLRWFDAGCPDRQAWESMEEVEEVRR